MEKRLPRFLTMKEAVIGVEPGERIAVVKKRFAAISAPKQGEPLFGKSRYTVGQVAEMRELISFNKLEKAQI